MANFNPGDVVELKSGGPKMTVATFDRSDNSYWCEWFLGSEKKGASFHAETLKLAEDPPRRGQTGSPPGGQWS